MNANENEFFRCKISKAKALMFRANSQKSCTTSKIINKLGRNLVEGKLEKVNDGEWAGCA